MTTQSDIQPSSKKRSTPPVITQPEIEREHDVELDTPPVEEEKETPTIAEPTNGNGKTKVEVAPKAKAVSSVIESYHRKEDEAVVEWLGSLQNKGPIQIRLVRAKPSVFNGKNVKGHLETLDDIISEDEIAQMYGGGTYNLRVMKKNNIGSWVFFTSTTVDVAGDPRIDNLPKAEPNSDGGASARADGAASNDRVVALLDRELERSRAQPNQNQNFEQMKMFMAPLELQIRSLSDALAKKDQQIQELANKPQNPFQEKLLDKMIDQDSARVEAVRSQLMSEIRVIKENAIADEKRLRDSFERERDAMKRDHERELDRMKSSYDRELAATKSMNEHVNLATTTSAGAQRSQLEADNRRLERDLVELRTEVKDLRAKKDQSPLEKAKELAEFKEALGIDGDEEEKEKGTLERVMETALGSEKLFGFLGKFAGPIAGAPANQQQAQPQQQQQMQARPRVIRHKSGQIYQLGPDNEYHPIRQRRQSDGSETGEMELGVEIPAEQVAMATTILEQSFLAGKKPEVVAATISTALPAEIFQAIRDHGVDGFLKKVAKLGATSPLRRQDGINWLRKLGKTLVGDTSPEETEEPVE